MREINFPILIVVVIGGLVLANGALAQEGRVGISISPLTFELTANPGDVLVNKLRVLNPTNSTIAIKMEIEDFTVSGELGQVIIEPGETETYSLKKWITTQPETISLGPNEQKFVEFTINIPENAEPGGHYGSILASTAGVTGPEITGTAIAQKVGALVLLTVSGEVVENLRIEEFTAPSFLEYGPVPFTLRFENTGTVHVRPRGFVTITDWRGKKAADVEFSQRNVIPGSIRKIDVSWNKKWLFGRYTATVVGSYGTENQPISPQVVLFWVFPWKVAIGVFLALVLLIIYFAKTGRRWRLALRILIRGEQR